MNNLFIKSSGSVFVAVGISLTAGAQEINRANQADNDLTGGFSLSYRAAIGVSASFSGAGGFKPPGGSGIYNDGFVGTDSTGNAGGDTTYWGYQNASQISGDNLLLHRYSGSAVNTGGSDAGSPQNGIEFSYQQPLTRGEWNGGIYWKLGVEGAVNWNRIGIADNHPLSGSVKTTTDTYSLGGIIPPTAPYSGPRTSGPGSPLLNATPTSSSGGTQNNAEQITGSREIDADLYGFRLGPYLEFPIGHRFSIGLGAGLAGGVIRSKFSYAETVTIDGVGTQSRVGSGRETGGLIGGYLRAQAGVQLWRNLSVFGSAEFNDLGYFNQTVGGETAHLDLSHTLYVSGGLSWTF